VARRRPRGDGRSRVLTVAELRGVEDAMEIVLEL
jgi:hypothetical protein